MGAPGLLLTAGDQLSQRGLARPTHDEYIHRELTGEDKERFEVALKALREELRDPAVVLADETDENVESPD